MILINGCSFTALQSQWPEYFPLLHNNIAVGGSSNDYIFFSTLKELQQRDYESCIVVWSFTTRTMMTTANSQLVNILPNTPIPQCKGDDYLDKNISGVEIEQALERFKRDYYLFFHNEELQQEKLQAYQHAISSACKNAIHFTVDDIVGAKDSTGHPTAETSKRFANHIMEKYFNE